MPVSPTAVLSQMVLMQFPSMSHEDVYTFNERARGMTSFESIIRRIASRIASLSSVQQAVERICAMSKYGYGVYHPNMKQISPGEYEGDFGNNWILNIREAGGNLVVKLNGKPFKDIEAAVDAYVAGRAAGPGAIAPAGRNVLIAPANGTVSVLLGPAPHVPVQYHLRDYDYDGSHRERIVVDMTIGGISIEMDMESSLTGGTIPHVYRIDGQDFSQAIRTKDDAAVRQATGGNLGIIETYQAASGAFENAAKQKDAEIPEWSGNEGTFSSWLMADRHQVVHGELILNTIVSGDVDGGDADGYDEEYDEEKP